MAALLAVPLGGCSIFGAPREIRGNRVDPEQLAQITPGVQTRQDVTALLGSPSATGTFDPNEWYYISEVTHIRPAQMPGVSDQRVVAISFDQNGVVRNIRELTDKDRQDVTFVSRETPSPGTERTVLQQLFGNIGRFNGAGAMGSATGDQGPGGGPGR